MKRFRIKLALVAMLAAVPAFAHESKGVHGGRVVDAGKYHVELVVADGNISVFVTDADDKPIAPAGFKGLAILNAGGKVQRINLSAANGKLEGKADVPLSTDVKGVVQLTPPDGKIAQGQFK